MITASQLRTGMAIKYEGQKYRVLVADYHPGQGKMGGVTHVRLQNLSTATFWEHSLRSDLKLEEIPVDRLTLEFLYADADQSRARGSLPEPDSWAFDWCVKAAFLICDMAKALLRIGRSTQVNIGLGRASLPRSRLS